MSAAAANGPARTPTGGPVILVVAEDFGSLLGPLAWLSEAGYDVRACLGPLAADRVCRMFDRDGICLELASCDLLLTNEPLPRSSPILPPPRWLVREARLRREELPILVVAEEGEHGEDAAAALNASVVAPRKAAVLERVAQLVGVPAGG
jgi:hypothetical protein